jgi:hypothetical protein
LVNSSASERGVDSWGWAVSRADGRHDGHGAAEGDLVTRGEYTVENHGVAPDVEVDLHPAAWRAGHDTHLERALALLMQGMQIQQAGAPKRPPFPTFAQDKMPEK